MRFVPNVEILELFVGYVITLEPTYTLEVNKTVVEVFLWLEQLFRQVHFEKIAERSTELYNVQLHLVGLMFCPLRTLIEDHIDDD